MVLRGEMAWLVGGGLDKVVFNLNVPPHCWLQDEDRLEMVSLIVLESLQPAPAFFGRHPTQHSFLPPFAILRSKGIGSFRN